MNGTVMNLFVLTNVSILIARLISLFKGFYMLYMFLDRPLHKLFITGKYYKIRIILEKVLNNVEIIN